MKLPAIICVSVFALFGACEKKAAAHGNPPPATATDTELERRVRQAITDDTTLQPTASAVTVTAASGVVTLRGTVKAQKDKEAIAAKAKAVAGVTSVTNDITVTG